MPTRRAGAICLVTAELHPLYRNGGIGTYYWLVAKLLASAGWQVHILLGLDPLDDPARAEEVRHQFAADGIRLHLLNDFPAPEALAAAHCHPWDTGTLSERVRAALERLHADHRFDLIEFPEFGGLGFRTVQAKRTGCGFADTQLVVKLHSPSRWCREANRAWPHDPRVPLTDHCERYSFDHADRQWAPCRYILGYAKGIGWDVRPDAEVVANCFEPAPASRVPETAADVREVVFFGRLETRKGLDLFLAACDALPPDLPVTFLGRSIIYPDGKSSVDRVRRALPGRRVTALTDLDRQGAVDYLTRNRAVAVIPSLTENYPNTVIECLTGGVPFVATRVGGIPELVTDPGLQSAILCEPTPADLRRCLTAYLGARPEHRVAWAKLARGQIDVGAHNARVVEQYGEVLRPRTAEFTAPARPDPKVTVAVTHYNLGDYLPATLASLAAQTYPHLEVLVLDDGSTDPASRRAFAEMATKYPRFRFLTQPNAGVGAARNRLLAEATGDFFLPVDADNLAKPEMVAAFVQGMQSHPTAAALTCYNLGFRDAADIPAGRFTHSYLPVGGPLVLGLCENVYGDTNGLFRTAALRSVGGFETARHTPCQDWVTYLKLVRAGHPVDVLPAVLYHYRVRADGMLQSLNRDQVNRFLTHQLLVRTAANGPLTGTDQAEVWEAVVGGFHRELELRAELARLRRVVEEQAGHFRAHIAHLADRAAAAETRLGWTRYKTADWVHRQLARIPGATTAIRLALRGVRMPYTAVKRVIRGAKVPAAR